MTDKILFTIVSSLILIGILFSYSLPVYFTHVHGIGEFHFFRNELIAGGVGLFLIFFISKLNPEFWFKIFGSVLFGLFFIIMILMIFLPNSIVPEINGAKRWLNLPGFNLSPVEFFKIGFIFFLSWSLTRKFYGNTHGSFWHEVLAFIPYVLLLLVLVLLIVVMQNDFGQMVIIGLTTLLMTFFSGSSFKLFISLFVAAITSGIGIIIIVSNHGIQRILQWWAGIQESILSIMPDFIASALRVETENINQAYQVGWSLKAIFNGGFTGTGVGGGIVKLGYLSDVHTDFVLAGIAEETGIVGITIITILMILMIFRIFKIASRSDNHVYYLFSLGIGIMVSSQFLMNSMGIIGLIPLKGIAVPFISYGGSSMLALSIGVGMVLMISKRAKL